MVFSLSRVVSHDYSYRCLNRKVERERKYHKPYWRTMSHSGQRQIGRHFPDDVFKCIFLHGNEWNSIKISLKFVPNGPIDNESALVQIIARCRTGDKPLFEPMVDLDYWRMYASLSLNLYRQFIQIKGNSTDTWQVKLNLWIRITQHWLELMLL